MGAIKFYFPTFLGWSGVGNVNRQVPGRRHRRFLIVILSRYTRWEDRTVTRVTFGGSNAAERDAPRSFELITPE